MEFQTITCKTPTCHECQCAIDLSAHLNTHITPLLQQLHWLPIRLRIEILILLITFKVLFYRHPVMIYSVIRREFFWALQSISQKLPLGIDPLWRQCHGFGTVSPKALDLLAPKVMLNRNLTHFYSARHFVGTISLYLGFYIVFLQITFLITICKQWSFRLWFHSDCK